MKLSDCAEEILESLWIAVEEKKLPALDPQRTGISLDDPAYSELVDLGLIEIRQGMVYFKPDGRDEGRMTIRRHRLAELLTMDILNIRGKEGDSKACLFEHLLKEGVDVKICTMLNHPTSCPHGNSIPPGECCFRAKAEGDLGIVPLTEFKSGQEGEIAYIQTNDNKKMQKLMAMGVLPGNRIVLTQAYPSYVFRVGYSEFAIDTNLAKEIFVRK